MQDVDEPLILPPFKVVTWSSVSDCQTREGRGNRHQKKRLSTECRKSYPDHDDPSDVAFLARHHKLEREEKLSHYYMRTMQNKDGPEKHDKRVEQTIKSMRPPPIAEGRPPHAPCRLQCTCCPCHLCSQLGVEPHKSLANTLGLVRPPALHLLTLSGLLTEPKYLSYEQQQAMDAAQCTHDGTSSTGCKSIDFAVTIKTNRDKRIHSSEEVLVFPPEQRIRQTVPETHVANAADSKDLQCTIVDPPRYLGSTPETAAGHLPSAPSAP
eukprot:EG_transcript_24462